jgi:hemoglobin
MGGTAGCRKLAQSFYTRVAKDPLLSPLFPAHMKCPIEEFSAFLIQFLGGPAEDSQRRWWLSLKESHDRFRLGDAERRAWLGLMDRTIDDSGIDPPVRAALKSLFEQSSRYLIGQEHSPCGELEDLWQAQLALDAAAAAIKAGDTGLACALAVQCSRGVLPGVLAKMIRSGRPELEEFAISQIGSDPKLLHERYAGRTLIHEAAAAGNRRMVEFLLAAGADPSAQDSGSHTPLYSLANECARGAEIVPILIRAGAHVDACDGVQRTTALHMAARRGNMAVARALLVAGADPHARDRKGNTPAQRALNCRNPELAELLAKAVRS